MKIRKTENLNRGELIKADLYSRPNATSGKYKMGQLGLHDLAGIKDSDTFYLETLKMKADLADKMIAEAEAQGKDTTDRNVMKELGEELNATITPIHKTESIMAAVFVSLQLMAYYGIAIGIWSLFFRKSFLVFGLYGVIAGLLISLLFVAPVVAFQRTRQRIRNISSGVGLTLGNIGIAIGILGIAAWAIRAVIF